MAHVPKLGGMIEAPHENMEQALTCGIELEFLVPSISHKKPDPDPDVDQELYTTFKDELEYIHHDIRGQLLQTLQQRLHHMEFRSSANDQFHPPHYNVIVYDTWRVDEEVTVEKEGGSDFDAPPGPYNWTPCELTSAVMPRDGYDEQVEDVCRVLKTIRIHLNKSTSVHVHIGLGNEPFSLLTVKKFATLYWVSERAVYELHHPSRRGNNYCFALTKYSHLGKKRQAVLDDEFGPVPEDAAEQMEPYIPKIKFNRTRSQIRRIWGCSDVQSIAELMQGANDVVPHEKAGGFRGSVGFNRFVARGGIGGNIQTFEWRQMAGTLDADHINIWIYFCMNFTDFCRRSDEHLFKAMMTNIMEKGRGLSGTDLLNFFGVNTEIFDAKVELWVADPTFRGGNRGKQLFVPKD